MSGAPSNQGSSPMLARAVFALGDVMRPLMIKGGPSLEPWTWLGRAAGALGRHELAGDFYDKAITWADGSRGRWAFLLRQEWEFERERHKWLSQHHEPPDELFRCSVTPLPNSEDGTPRAPAGYWRARFSTLGLRIEGFLARGVRGKVTVRLDGKPIKSFGVKNVSYRIPRFMFQLKRSALARFPASSVITLEIDSQGPLWYQGSPSARIEVPHGDGGLWALMERGIAIDKKGFVVEERVAVAQRQDTFLQIYDALRGVFEDELERPLFILYGTLLGFHRSGDFIPGDDDFDAGYVSKYSDPADVKRETMDIVVALIRKGFTVSFNRHGRLFRARRREDPPDVYLDLRPVWFASGSAWLHKQAKLPLEESDFLPVTRGVLRGITVNVIANPEKFLASYYGPGWKVPDPSYSNDRGISRATLRYLDRSCLNPLEYRELRARVEKLATTEDPSRLGKLVSLGSHDLYPLEQYELDCEW